MMAKTPPPLELEPSAPKGEVPPAVIEELRAVYANLKDASEAYSDAVKAQAEKYVVKPGALKRYIAALVNDKLEEAEAECKDLERLIG